jgi:hypothetical protein
VRTLEIWIPGLPLGTNAFRKLNTRGRMSRTEMERTKAKMCALAAVRPKYRAPDDVWLGPTAIDMEIRTSRVFKDLYVVANSLKAIQDGICLAVLPLGDGHKTPYQWRQPTQVKVKTRAEEGVRVQIAEVETT